jgi:hypothetical protein
MTALMVALTVSPVRSFTPDFFADMELLSALFWLLLCHSAQASASWVTKTIKFAQTTPEKPDFPPEGLGRPHCSSKFNYQKHELSLQEVVGRSLFSRLTVRCPLPRIEDDFLHTTQNRALYRLSSI